MEPLLSMVWLPQRSRTRHSPIRAAASPELVMLGAAIRIRSEAQNFPAETSGTEALRLA